MRAAKRLDMLKAIALVTLFAGCATDSDSVEVDEQDCITLQFQPNGQDRATELDPGTATPRSPLASRSEQFDISYDVVENVEADSICACDSFECAQQWIADNFGCGVCVDFVCGKPIGGCVPCN